MRLVEVQLLDGVEGQVGSPESSQRDGAVPTADRCLDLSLSLVELSPSVLWQPGPARPSLGPAVLLPV